MDLDRFDRLTRSLTAARSRRALLRGPAGAGLGLVAANLPAFTSANKRKKHKKKPLQLNTFGCVDVGGKCRGNSAHCCSGICQGKKPKRGKKDTSSCIGHNAGACTLDSCALGMAITCQLGQPNCQCVTTTGKANFCGDFTGGTQLCRVCQRDTDCQADLGPGAACVLLGGFCAQGCSATNGTACVPPCL